MYGGGGGVLSLRHQSLFDKYVLYNTAICLYIPLDISSIGTFIKYYALFGSLFARLCRKVHSYAWLSPYSNGDFVEDNATLSIWEQFFINFESKWISKISEVIWIVILQYAQIFLFRCKYVVDKSECDISYFFPSQISFFSLVIRRIRPFLYGWPLLFFSF